MDIHQQVLAHLNSGEWVYEDPRFKVVKAELLSDSLHIRTEHDNMVMRVELAPDQIFFCGDPCIQFVIFGNTQVSTKVQMPLSINAQTFMHKDRWQRACREKAFETLRARFVEFIGKTMTEISTDDDEGTCLHLHFGDEKLSILSDGDDPYADGTYFRVGAEWFPRSRREFLELGEQLLGAEFETAQSAHMKSFYTKAGGGRASISTKIA